MAYQEFLCIGGPEDGKKHTLKSVPAGYQEYIRSFRTKTLPSLVLIHESLINGSKAPKLPRMPRQKKQVEVEYIPYERVI